MKKVLLFTAAFAISTFTLAGDMSGDNDMSTMHSQMMDKSSTAKILKDEDMQRLHRDMTLYAMSELGMEARLKMMTEEGRAFHNALKQSQKNTAR